MKIELLQNAWNDRMTHHVTHRRPTDYHTRVTKLMK